MIIELIDQGDQGVFHGFEKDIQIGEVHFTRINDHQIAIDHTEVYTEYNGKGLGQKMVLEVFDYARNNRLKIKPRCSFVRFVFDKNPGSQDLLIG